MIKPIYELLLWNNCNNNCKFCFMKYHHHDNKFLSDNGKAESINKAIEFLNSPTFKDGSHVLLVGGELFDVKFSTETEKAFLSFLKTVVGYMVSGKVDLLYINTNLIYKDKRYLYYFLDLIKDNNLFDRLKFTTSYDIDGRFKDDSDKKLVEDNLSILLGKYPSIRIVVNMIMTKQFCDSVLSDFFSVKDFIRKYRVQVNTIPYIILREDMAASRGNIYKTLLKLDREIPGYLRAYIDNVSIEQDKWLYEYDGNGYVYMTAKNAECGHNENFHLYVPDKSRCFICDMIKLGEVADV